MLTENLLEKQKKQEKTQVNALELVRWIERDLARWGKPNECFEVRHRAEHTDVMLFTNTNEYCLTVGVDYLGCTSKSRKFRAGEDWRRGSDLLDGAFSEETYQKILKDILSYELVRVSKQQAQPIAGLTN